MSRTAPAIGAHDLRAWRNAVFVVFSLSGLGFASWVSRIPAVRDELELSTATIGLMLFGLAIGSIVGLAVAPNYLNRFGARRGLRYAILTMSAATVVLGAAAGILESAHLTSVVLLCFGFSYSITDVVMNVEGAEVEKSLGKTVLPMMHAFFSLGTIAGAIAGAGAAAIRLPVGIHLGIMGVLMACIGVAAVHYIPRPGATPGTTTSPTDAAPGTTTTLTGAVPARRVRRIDGLLDALRLVREPQLVLLGLMVVGMAFAEGSANDWLPLAAVDGHGFGNATGALVYGAFVGAMTLGRATGGPLIDRFGRSTTLTAMAGLGLVGIVLFIVTDHQWVAFIAAALWGLGGSLGFPVGISAAADHPTNAARRVSMVSIFGYTAFLVGPPVLGFLGEHWGILNAFYVVAAMLLVSLLVTPRAMRSGTARPGERRRRT